MKLNKSRNCILAREFKKGSTIAARYIIISKQKQNPTYIDCMTFQKKYGFICALQFSERINKKSFAFAKGIRFHIPKINKIQCKLFA